MWAKDYTHNYDILEVLLPFAIYLTFIVMQLVQMHHSKRVFKLLFEANKDHFRPKAKIIVLKQDLDHKDRFLDLLINKGATENKKSIPEQYNTFNHTVSLADGELEVELQYRFDCLKKSRYYYCKDKF